MGNLLADLVLRIRADLTGLISGLNTAASRVERFGQSVTYLGTRMTTFARAMIGIGVAASATFVPMLKVAADFERKMDAVKAIVEASAGSAASASVEYAKFTETVQRLGRETRFTATQVAEGALFLVRAGFSVQEAGQGLQSVLNLAAIGAMDLARASEIAADVSRAFRLEALSLNRVVDVLAVVAVSANTSVESLGYALSFASPVAASLGVSLEHVTAALGVLANAGIKGTTAGTAMSRIMDSLARGTELTARTLNNYGLSLADTDVSARGLLEVLATLEGVLISTGDAALIFGVRGGRAMLALMNQGTRVVEEFAEKTEKAALASSLMLETMEDNLIGVLLKLKSAFEDLAIALIGDIDKTDSFAAALVRAALRVLEVVFDVKIWVKENEKLAGQLVGIAASLGAFAVALGFVVLPLGLFIQSFGGVILFLKGLATVALSVGSVLVSSIGPPLMALAAFIALIAVPAFEALKAKWEDIRDTAIIAFRAAKVAILDFWEGFKRGFAVLRPTLTETRFLFEKLITDILKVVGVLTESQDSWDAFGEVVGFVLGKIISVILEFVNAMYFMAGAVTEFLGEVASEFIKTARFLGVIDHGTKTFTETLEELRAARRALTEEADAGVATAKEEALVLAQQVADRQKILDLLIKGKSLKPQELRDLADRKEAQAAKDPTLGGGDLREAALRDLAEAEEKLLDIQREVAHARAVVAPEALRKWKAAERTAQQNVQRSKDELALYQKVLEEQPELLLRAAKADRAAADLIESRIEAQRVLAETAEDFAKLQESLRERELEGLAKELREITQSRDLQAKMAKDRIAAMRIEIAALKEATDSKESEAVIRVRLNRIKELENDITKTQNAAILIETRRREDLLKVIAAEREKREDLIRDARIDDAKLRGDILKAAELEANKLLEVEEKKNQEILANARAAGAKELAHARNVVKEKRAIDARRAGDIIRKAEEEVFGGKDGVNHLTERSLALEADVTKQLASQVHSLQDMFLLYRAIAMIRQEQERRAFVAARVAFNSEQKLEKLREAFARKPSAGLKRLIEEAELREKFAKGIADKRAKEAALDLKGGASGTPIASSGPITSSGPVTATGPVTILGGGIGGGGGGIGGGGGGAGDGDEGESDEDLAEKIPKMSVPVSEDYPAFGDGRETVGGVPVKTTSTSDATAAFGDGGEAFRDGGETSESVGASTPRIEDAKSARATPTIFEAAQAARASAVRERIEKRKALQEADIQAKGEATRKRIADRKAVEDPLREARAAETAKRIKETVYPEREAARARGEATQRRIGGRDDLNPELNPPQAPSLDDAIRDFFKPLDTVTAGLEDLSSALQDVISRSASSPNLGGIAPPVPNVEGLAAAASSITPAPNFGGDFNDNRSVSMDVNSNLDLANVSRHIGLAVGNAYNAVGTV
jgi:TP901 family phage tail tape measure protein